MPEELAVVLVVLCAAAWVIYKTIQGMQGTVKSLEKQLRGFVDNARSKRFRKRRGLFATHVRAFVPNELQLAERHFQSVQTQFDQLKQASVWTPERPIWDRLEFPRHKFADQGRATQQLNIFDVHAILRPNNPSWQQQEQEMVSRSCSYPADLTTVKQLDFHEFPIPSLTIAPALFTVVRGTINDKEVETYFSEERMSVAVYNRQRDELLAKHAALVSSITTWNMEERIRYQQYRDECDAFEREEQSLFQKQSKKYEADCHQELTEISQTLDGFRTKVKSLVLKRVDQILASLKLPLSLPRFWNLDYDEAEQILIAEIALPDVVHVPPIKSVLQKSGDAVKPLNQTERKELVPKIQPANHAPRSI